MKVYGPYLNKDSRRRVVLKYKNRVTSMSYSKYQLLKSKIKIKENQVVHHLDHNPLNDNIDNYKVMSRTEHLKLHQTKPPEKFICPICKNSFELYGRRLSYWKSNKKVGHSNSGPYCSRICVGKIKPRGRGETGRRIALKTQRRNP